VAGRLAASQEGLGSIELVNSMELSSCSEADKLLSYSRYSQHFIVT
jgi:hypothetical protein